MNMKHPRASILNGFKRIASTQQEEQQYSGANHVTQKIATTLTNCLDTRSERQKPWRGIHNARRLRVVDTRF